MADAAPNTTTPLADVMRRADRAWIDKQAWQSLYDDAYEFAIPYRRPPRQVSRGANRVDRLFDSTAITSAMRFAGQLQQDLFPPGQPFFALRPGPVTRLAQAKEQEPIKLQLEAVSRFVEPFFMSGEWDQAMHEMCVDLGAGTGCMLILEGTADRPVRFVTLPIDEIALEQDGYGEIMALFWRTKMRKRAVRMAFPSGRFPTTWADDTDQQQNDECELVQAFVVEGGGWRLMAYTTGSVEPIVTQRYRTRPFLAPRYYRVPGEEYGRGPILLALPMIKTLNKAMELTLKAAAIQMLGIWGYRPGGSFNPDTARIAPGVFWALQSTGGVLGPDVQRLDPATGRIDVSNIILQDLRAQVQAAMHDQSLPDKGATPVSASEVIARMKQVQQNYVGAYGRLIHEIVPVAVRRVIEILYNARLLQNEIAIDQLLVQTEVLSPMAAALRLAHVEPVINYIAVCAQVSAAPASIDMHVKRPEALDRLGEAMGVPQSLRPTADERQALEAKQVQTAALAFAASQALQQSAAGDPAATALAGVPA